MKRTAQTHHPIHTLLKDRWSPRAFSDKPVEPEKLLAVLEAARWAASAMNEQPWRFIIATKKNPAEFEQALSCLNEGNQRWAKDAPVLIFTIVKKTFTRNDRPNRAALHDLGLAVANLTLQATELGLHVHEMGGIQIDRIRETYQIPEDYEVVTGIALGYYGDIEQLPEDLQEREKGPRQRKPLSELIFTGTWAKPASFVKNNGT
ncbi:MAG: nitroreductase family protein [Anaerolineae bacterium]|nr:nitroreductase family protein [Anaerolineae bacterium]MCB0222671.1 nitroreductase family protein [Anaerolineae bacterium]